MQQSESLDDRDAAQLAAYALAANKVSHLSLLLWPSPAEAGVDYIHKCLWAVQSALNTSQSMFMIHLQTFPACHDRSEAYGSDAVRYACQYFAMNQRGNFSD